MTKRKRKHLIILYKVCTFYCITCRHLGDETKFLIIYVCFRDTYENTRVDGEKRRRLW